MRGAPIEQRRNGAGLKSSSCLCSVTGKATLKLPNANERPKRLSAARRSGTSRPLSNCQRRNKATYVHTALVATAARCRRFLLLPTCPCSNRRWICHSPSVQGGRVEAVRGELQCVQQEKAHGVCWFIQCWHPALIRILWPVYGSAPAFPSSVSVVFVFTPLLGLEHKPWALRAGQAGHPCRSFWGVVNLR